MTTDRAALERALYTLNQYFVGNRKVCPDTELAQIGAAARAHLATLPKTKMVERWHVEWAAETSPGYWVARTECDHRNKYSADVMAASLVYDKTAHCVRVTGPHQHEVPA